MHTARKFCLTYANSARYQVFIDTDLDKRPALKNQMAQVILDDLLGTVYETEQRIEATHRVHNGVIYPEVRSVRQDYVNSIHMRTYLKSLGRFADKHLPEFMQYIRIGKLGIQEMDIFTPE